ncbi:MAG TPA: hypothetical protein DHV36_19780, partial [Desulfobacteraceae bacterium]|nr:hypothetical protein [Desulfobacteraceae bacterium]
MNGSVPPGKATGYLAVIHLLLAILAAVCTADDTLPQVTGKPFSNTYPPIVYKGQNQVYDVVKDHRGVLFAGNNVNGVLEYDGITWRTIALSNNNTAYSLSVSKSGQVFVAGAGEIGFLSQVNGKTIYQSLLPHLPEPYRKFGRAQVKCIADRTYFNTGTAIFLWENNGFFAIENPSGSGFDDLFAANGAIYTSDRDGTIFMIRDRTAEPVFREQPEVFGGYIFKNEYDMPSINLILPLDPDTILIGTYFRGFLTFDGRQLAPFETEADAFLIGNMGYSGTRLNNGEFAVSTVDRGVIVIDRGGRLKAWFRQDNGLTENIVYGVFQDTHNGLWIATDFGLNQMLYPSPFTRYDRESGLAGQVRKTAELNGTLYVATSRGAFKSRSPASALGLEFERITGIHPSETGAVAPFGNTVLFGSIFGLFQVTPMASETPVLAVPWLKDRDCRFIEVSRKCPGIVYAGTAYDGIHILRFRENQWTREGHIPLNDAVFFGAEDKDGRLWVTGMNSGMYRIDFSTGGFEQPGVKNYYTNQGLPEGYYAASIVDRDIFLYSDEVFLSYNREADRFVPDTRFFDDPTHTGILDQTPDGSVWFTKGRPRRLGLAVKQQKKDGVYHRLAAPFQRFNNFQIRNVGYDGNNRTYLGADQSLLVYDAGIPFPSGAPFTTLIRKITVNGTPVFGPGAPDTSPGATLRLKHTENALRFDYAGLFTDVSFGNRYAVQLEGLESGFSQWGDAAYKEYTNLEPGQYRFLVKSRNLYGTRSDTAAIAFKILPPWWETWWFYLAEISLLLLLILASFLLNRSGEVSRFTKVVTFVTLVVVFESIMFVAEPFAEAFGGGVPVVQLLLNIGLAMMLQPSQELVSRLLIARRKKRRYRVTFDRDGQWHGGAH